MRGILRGRLSASCHSELHSLSTFKGSDLMEYDFRNTVRTAGSSISPKPVILLGFIAYGHWIRISNFRPRRDMAACHLRSGLREGIGNGFHSHRGFHSAIFSKVRGLALDMNYVGSTAADSVFPVFITFLLGEYGFR